jgi:hypothetical protein
MLALSITHILAVFSSYVVFDISLWIFLFLLCHYLHHSTTKVASLIRNVMSSTTHHNSEKIDISQNGIQPILLKVIYAIHVIEWPFLTHQKGHDWQLVNTGHQCRSYLGLVCGRRGVGLFAWVCVHIYIYWFRWYCAAGDLAHVFLSWFQFV